MRIGRRGLLLAPLATPALALAQTGELVVGTWGGDYAALLASEVEQPLLAPRGVRPVHDVGTPAARETRLIAERTARRASMDVVCLGDADTHAQRMGFLPTTTDAALPPALQAEIGLMPEQQAKLRRQDFDYLARSNAETLGFWNREFKG